VDTNLTTDTFHTEKSNKMRQSIKMYYSIFICSSTCFGRNTAHHQEPKSALAASGFAYVVVGRCQRPATTRPTTFHVCKTRGCQCSFRLLMLGGVSPETCWATYKYGIINFDTLLHLVGFFCMNFTMMRGSTNIKLICLFCCNIKKLGNVSSA